MLQQRVLQNVITCHKKSRERIQGYTVKIRYFLKYFCPPFKFKAVLRMALLSKSIWKWHTLHWIWISEYFPFWTFHLPILDTMNPFDCSQVIVFQYFFFCLTKNVFKLKAFSVFHLRLFWSCSTLSGGFLKAPNWEKSQKEMNKYLR